MLQKIFVTNQNIKRLYIKNIFNNIIMDSFILLKKWLNVTNDNICMFNKESRGLYCKKDITPFYISNADSFLILKN